MYFDIYNMALFEGAHTKASNGLSIEILRVPGGWLIAWGNYQPQFVEFHNGFQTLAALEVEQEELSDGQV